MCDCLKPPNAHAQLVFDCDAWLRWRLPFTNSFSFSMAAVLMSSVSALSAVYFVVSAVCARRHTLGRVGSEAAGAINTANKAAMRRLMRRVLASGCLMLFVTSTLAVSTTIIFHPTGFAVVCMALFPAIMVNSLIRIDSFAPATGAPIGPLRCAALITVSGTRYLMKHVDKRLASSSAPEPNRLVRAAKARRSRRFSHIDL